MRTPIPEALEQRIDRVHEKAGYATKSEFVRDAVRHLLTKIEEERFTGAVAAETHFSYSTHSPKGPENHTIKLKPTTDSPLNMMYHTPGHPDNNVSLNFGEEQIDRDAVESALSDIEGVAKAWFNTDPAIAIKIPKDTHRSFSAIIRDIFDTLYSTIDIETGGEFSGYREEKLRHALDTYADRAEE
ncbi:ribbon-helix-helix domain-containing protein [Halobacterium salinarum]|uniref:ribbon-helix-helix domain-containing protein n=1 Tax=Halobacterium salinarum TaxID=2242 RepID=UPI002553B7CE|nr:ribbon-helix-helix domain-containing protein [Halobacterium salinarum]MDL0140303.1 ribbon-helix-helix domain-containing protein [Halobacterium salinarum]